MSADSSKLAADRDLLLAAEGKGTTAKLRAFARLSGPGWLQSALTLGGGTLAGSLYLGVLSGPHLLWLQPLAMALGVIMTSAIGYVTLSTREQPLQAVSRYINPVMAWGWALGALATCMVWVMPQYSLSNAVVQQILLPDILGASSQLGEMGGRIVITSVIFITVVVVSWNYGRGGKGVQLYEGVLKLTVLAIVICFLGVVYRLGTTAEGLDWGALFKGFIPNPGAIFKPGDAFVPLLDAVPAAGRDYWSQHLVLQQRDVAVTVAAATIGINGTFLFAYSLRRHGWGKEFRGFMKFDLATGMFIPFVLVTACIVVAAASQFHAVPQPGLLPESAMTESTVTPRQRAEFASLLRGRVLHENKGLESNEVEIERRVAGLGPADRVMAATLVTRDAFDLASSLRPFTGDFVARIVFTFGVLGMTLSSITLQMVICGMVMCELLGRPLTGWTFRLGTLAAATGILGPFIWSAAAFWLVVPTSIFAFTLLPIAYVTFLLLLNQRKLLGAEMPTGGRRWAWNLMLGVIVAIFAPASLYMVWDKGGYWGIGLVGVFLIAIVISDLKRRRNRGDGSPNRPPVPENVT